MRCFLFFYFVHASNVFFFFQAEDGIRDGHVTGVQTCALPIWDPSSSLARSMVPPGPVLWPVLEAPEIAYQMLSNPRCGWIVSWFACSGVIRTVASWTRMYGSTIE